MSDQIIVMVSDPDDNRRGEITVFDNPRKAEVLVETLLEAGFDQGRIRLFNGSQAEMQVSFRPAVALVDETAPPVAVDRSPAREPMQLSETAREASEPAPTPFMKDGVRFSSLFRQA